MSTPVRPCPWSPARKDTATNAQRDLGPESAPDDELGAAGNIVTIEQGRERRARRDGGREKGERPDRSEARQDRADRRERRRSGKADAPVAAAESDVADADVVAANADAVAVSGDQGSAAVAVAESPVAPAEPEDVRSGVLVAPILDAGASQRTVERTRVQLEQAEQAIANAPEVVGLVAPLVRHVNTVTEQLNEAQITVGRLMAERDALRARLAEAEGVSVDEIAVMTLQEPGGDGDAASRRLQRIEARQVASPGEEKKPNPLRPVGIMLGFVPEADSFDGLKRMARRRQLFAAVVLVAAFTAMRIATANGVEFDNMSRDGLADLQYVGSIFQIFIIAWMLYRIVRVSGKGVSWLFPDPNGRKRRR